VKKYTLLAALIIASCSKPDTEDNTTPAPSPSSTPTGQPPGPTAAAVACSTEQVDDGVIISCPDGTKAVVRNGLDGVSGKDGSDGKSCSIAWLKVPQRLYVLTVRLRPYGTVAPVLTAWLVKMACSKSLP
jgi:hypothetical protein